MSEAVVRQAVEACMARDLDGILAVADAEIVLRSLLTEAERPLYRRHVTATGAGSGVPIDQTYWLGARVRGAKIVFFGFLRTESDALEAVT